MNIVTRHPKFFWALIAFLAIGSLWEMYPLSNQSLIQEFQDKADYGTHNAAFDKIVKQARELQAAHPDPTREFTDLMTAIGTNDVPAVFSLLQCPRTGKPHLHPAQHPAAERRPAKSIWGWIFRAARNSG